MSDIAEAILAATTAQVRAQNLYMEALLTEALMLQDYDKLDHLTRVYQDGHTPSVASWVVEH